MQLCSSIIPSSRRNLTLKVFSQHYIYYNCNFTSLLTVKFCFKCKPLTLNLAVCMNADAHILSQSQTLSHAGHTASGNFSPTQISIEVCASYCKHTVNGPALICHLYQQWNISYLNNITNIVFKIFTKNCKIIYLVN